MGKVECLVNMAALLLGCLGGSVPKVDISEAVKKNRATSGFGLQVILRGSLCISGPWTFQIYCGTRSNTA